MRLIPSNVIRFFLLIALLINAGNAFARQGGRAGQNQAGVVASQGQGQSEIQIVLRDDPTGRTINIGFLATNILYWIDNDEAWAKKGVPQRLQQLRIKTLRYPGGEVADNYDWESNSIVRKDKFPFEAKTEDERKGRLDYLEFLANAKKIGIENISFVVNLESAFAEPGDIDANIAKYADKAARWVKAVKAAGYTVRYWEIGNESYLRSSYGLTAYEYALALKVYYRKMKAADPSIRIGAIGPISAIGGDAIGFADALGNSGLGKFRTLLRKGEEPCKKTGKKACFEELREPVRRHEGAVWWDVLLTESGDSFDFAVIHRYRSERMHARDYVRPLVLKEDIRSLKTYLETRKRGKMELALTEWNTPGKSNAREMEQEHAVDIAEQLGQYLEGGVDMAFYWPWRIKGEKWFSVMSEKDDKVYAMYLLFDLFQRYHRSRLMLADYDAQQGVYALASQDAAGKTAFLVNHTSSNKRITVRYGTAVTPGSFIKESLIGTADGSRLEKSAMQPLSASAPEIQVDLPPRSVMGILIQFK